MARKNKKKEHSKLLSTMTVVFGFITVQECFVVMLVCILKGYTATASWLTAAVGLAEAVIGTGLTAYISLCKTDHSAGGITYDKAKAKNWNDDESI